MRPAGPRPRKKSELSDSTRCGSIRDEQVGVFVTGMPDTPCRLRLASPYLLRGRRLPCGSGPSLHLAMEAVGLRPAGPRPRKKSELSDSTRCGSIRDEQVGVFVTGMPDTPCRLRLASPYLLRGRRLPCGSGGFDGPVWYPTLTAMRTGCCTLDRKWGLVMYFVLCSIVYYDTIQYIIQRKHQMVTITAETVAAAADRLHGDGTNPTQSAVRTALDRAWRRLILDHWPASVQMAQQSGRGSRNCQGRLARHAGRCRLGPRT